MPGPEGIDRCVDQVRQVGNLSKADAQAVLQGVLDRGDRRGGDPMVAGRELGDIADAVAKKEQANRLGNLRDRMSRRQRIEERIEPMRGRFGKQGLTLAIENEVRAFNTPTRGGRLSAERQARSQAELYSGGALQELEHAGLMAPLRKAGDFARMVGKEVYELSMQAAGEPANPGVTGSKEAKAAADILHKWQSLAKQNLNRAGAWIGDYAGYITRTTHDPRKMFTAKFEGWRDFILPLLDKARTFEGVSDIDKFLRQAYNGLKTGIHFTEDGGVGFKDPAFKGPGNLAEKLSQARVLHFRDADAWLDYQEKFGAGKLPEQFIRSFERAGKQQALLERWGTNPRAEFDQDMTYFEQKYRDSDPDGAAYLRQHQAKLNREFDYLDGRANIPENEMVSEISQGIRNVQSMAKLGFVAFTHLYSMATKVAELRYQGVGFLERWGNVLSSLAQGPRGRGETRQLYDLLLAGFEGQHAHYVSRFTLDDGLPGAMSTATSTFMKWTGLDYVLGAEKAGARAMLARHIGMQTGRTFDELEPETQRAFMQYDISPRDWDRLRAAPGHLTLGDRTFLTPDAARRAAPEYDQSSLGLETPPAKGTVRLYHGGAEYKGGSRFLTPYRDYAEGYANKGGGFVHYVDLPENHPLVQANTDYGSVAGTGMKAPINHFDAPEEIAKQLKPIGSTQSKDLFTPRERDDLALKLHAYYGDVADRAIITPGIAEKALLMQGTRPGTLLGEAVRFFQQFKMWPAAAVRQGLGREWYGNDTTGARVLGIVSLALATTVLGYGRMATTDLMKGLNPRDPRDPKTVAAALLQGGGLGILGDYLFGEFGRNQQDFASTILGPTFGTAAQVIDVWNHMKAAALQEGGHPMKAVPPELLRLTLDNTPFINMFYARTALNYLFLWRLQEAMNPGYQRRYEQRVKRERGQTFWLSPAQAVH